jgi:hypothetical protein
MTIDVVISARGIQRSELGDDRALRRKYWAKPFTELNGTRWNNFDRKINSKMDCSEEHPRSCLNSDACGSLDGAADNARERVAGGDDFLLDCVGTIESAGNQ